MMSFSWGILCLLIAIASLTAAIIVLRLSWRRRYDDRPGRKQSAQITASPVAQDDFTTAAFSPGSPVENQIGRYRILEHLGAGGMGTVYKALDPQLGRVVALKLPHFHGTGPEVAKRIQRFQREAQAAAKIWHPNVCPIYDVGDHQGRPFVVMAWVDGQSLAARLSEGGRSEDIGHALSLIRDILDGLDAIHAHGILHRDLKPANVLIDRSGRPIITDFGLARSEMNSDPITSEGVIVGTPSYMAPEQAKDPGALGPWTDIYSVGVIFYQMLTGRLPFEGAPLEILTKSWHEQPVAPTHYRSDLPPALVRLILKALARDPKDRFANARQFRAALDNWHTHPEISHEDMATTDWKPRPGADAHLQCEPPAGTDVTDPENRSSHTASLPGATEALSEPKQHSPLLPGKIDSRPIALIYLKYAGSLLWKRAKYHWRVLLLVVVGSILAIAILFAVQRQEQPHQAQPKPIRVGYIQGDLLVREPNGLISHSKCDGFKVECYETFVVVYVDSTQQPTWTGNFVLTIPWSKIEHMTLRPETDNK
jgi:serine/threonine protein kinase